MTGLRWLSSLVVLAGLLAFTGSKMPVYAQDDKEVKLEFKAFNKDQKPFYQELVTKTTQKMTVMGQEVSQVLFPLLGRRLAPDRQFRVDGHDGASISCRNWARARKWVTRMVPAFF